MAEKRKHTQSICVKIDAKTLFKIELFPAGQWAESAQQSADLAGRFRLRINRRWHNMPDGGPAYLDLMQVGVIVAALAAGMDVAPEPAPNVPKGTRVSVPNGRMLAGEPLYDSAKTHTDPIRGYDGRWYVNVVLFDKGSIMAPVDTLIIREGR